MTEEQEVIIIPPQEIKGVVDKTAEYVAQVGSSFESMVYAREKNNPKFQFLMPQSHYHVYYKQQVEFFKQGLEKKQEAQPVLPKEEEKQPEKEEKVSLFLVAHCCFFC
jgi:splicing factor 3A subunit 1